MLLYSEIQQHHVAGSVNQDYCSDGVVVPAAISSLAVTAVTVNEVYSYDVEASGYPRRHMG